MTMRALSVRQPWAWAIAHGSKTVENRSRATHHTGPIAIHASMNWDKAALSSPLVQTAWREFAHSLLPRQVVGTLRKESLWIEFGAVIAVADIVGCHQHTDSRHPCDHGDAPMCSPWAVRGLWHWQLAYVRPLRHAVPARGQLGLWHLPDHVHAQVQEEIDMEAAS